MRPIPRPGEAQPSARSVTMSRVRRGLAAVALLLVLAPAGPAATLPLTARLAQALAVPGSPTSTSAAVAIDLSSGKLLFGRNPDMPLAPASNEKLPVTFAALRELGTSYRFRTEILGRGRQVGATWQGDIFLKGFGDPTLTSGGIDRLAAQIEALGITQVSGRVLGDESWFDARRTAPGWKPAFYLSESPPLSALAVDRAVYDGHIALRPALAAAGQLRRALRRHGIASGSVGLGRAPAASPALAEVESARLPAVLQEMDRESDNFTAELMLKDLGAEIGTSGTTVAGAAVVTGALSAAGVPLAGVRIVDGSGLSLDDRLTAQALAAILVSAWRDPALHYPFWAALSVAGVNGTLEHRMRLRPARGAVHAKTGTTNEASALSGYAGSRYAFSVLQNGEPIATYAAQRAQDRFASALASVL